MIVIRGRFNCAFSLRFLPPLSVLPPLLLADPGADDEQNGDSAAERELRGTRQHLGGALLSKILAPWDIVFPKFEKRNFSAEWADEMRQLCFQ